LAIGFRDLPSGVKDTIAALTENVAIMSTVFLSVGALALAIRTLKIAFTELFMTMGGGVLFRSMAIAIGEITLAAKGAQLGLISMGQGAGIALTALAPFAAWAAIFAGIGFAIYGMKSAWDEWAASVKLDENIMENMTAQMNLQLKAMGKYKEVTADMKSGIAQGQGKTAVDLRQASTGARKKGNEAEAILFETAARAREGLSGSQSRMTELKSTREMIGISPENKAKIDAEIKELSKQQRVYTDQLKAVNALGDMEVIQLQAKLNEDAKDLANAPAIREENAALRKATNDEVAAIQERIRDIKEEGKQATENRIKAAMVKAGAGGEPLTSGAIAASRMAEKLANAAPDNLTAATVKAGRCYEKFAVTLKTVDADLRAQIKSTEAGSAYMFKAVAERAVKMGKLERYYPKSMKDVTPGSMAVYASGTTSEFGHIETVGKDKRGYSDKINNLLPQAISKGGWMDQDKLALYRYKGSGGPTGPDVNAMKAEGLRTDAANVQALLKEAKSPEARDAIIDAVRQMNTEISKQSRLSAQQDAAARLELEDAANKEIIKLTKEKYQIQGQWAQAQASIDNTTHQTHIKSINDELDQEKAMLTAKYAMTSSYGEQHAFADGGTPPIGEASLVGENGPELFVPRTSGSIIPNNRIGSALGGGGQTVNYNGPYIANMSAIDTQSATQFLSKNKTAVWAANMSASRGIPASR